VKTHRARILIVGDEPIKCSVLEEELGTAGYSVMTAANPLEAGRELAKSTFEVVVMNLQMSGHDGLSFLRELKNQNSIQSTIVIADYRHCETAIEAMKLGAFDYLQKPFSIGELLLKIDKLRRYERMASENDELKHQLALRRIENQNVALANVHGVEAAEVPDVATAEKSSDLLKLDRLIRYEQMASENEALHHELALPRIESKIVGQSEPMREILQRIRAVSASEATVLIEGESGTGKELIARTIHANSGRAAGPFVAIDCAALPGYIVASELFGREPGAFHGDTNRLTGRFELADGGTLFLGDVDAIRLDVQAKLVRVLQDREFKRVRGNRSIPVNVRLIAATKRSLSALVAMGNFHEDLFHKLNVVPLRVPPLRERVEDLPLLVEHFLETFAIKSDCQRLTFSPEGLAKLQRHSWPGNVRELEQMLEMMVALAKGDRLEVDEVPDLAGSQDPSPLLSLRMTGIECIDAGSVLEDLESRLIHWALEKAEGNPAKAAEMLSLPLSTLQYKITQRSTKGPA
jgi:DNA-binding NtrC family response regulator